MRWGKRGWCAVALLLMAGCALGDSFGLSVRQNGKNAYPSQINASVDSVSASVQASLRQMGLSAEVRPEGESIRIVSKLPSGGAFSFVLTKTRTSTGEQTLARVEWEKEKDGGAAIDFFARVCASAATGVQPGNNAAPIQQAGGMQK